MRQNRLSSLAIVCILRFYGNIVIVYGMDKILNINLDNAKEGITRSSRLLIEVIEYPRLQSNYFCNYNCFTRRENCKLFFFFM